MSLSCCLLPLSTDYLLLPAQAVLGNVALPYTPNVETDWHLGELEWQGMILPLISWELLTGGFPPFVTETTRAAIIRRLDQATPPYAILIQDTVITRDIQETDMVLEPPAALDSPELVLSRVRLGYWRAVIPDFYAIETQLFAVRTAEQNESYWLANNF